MSASAAPAATTWEEVRGLMQQLELLCSSSGAAGASSSSSSAAAAGAGASSADTLRLLASSRGELREVLSSAQTGAKKVIHDLSRAVVSARAARRRAPRSIRAPLCGPTALLSHLLACLPPPPSRSPRHP